MPNFLSSTLHRINNDDKPLNILCADTHEAYQTMLAKTGHHFFSLQHPSFRTWNTDFRRYPNNYFPMQGKTPDDQIKTDMVFDIVLSQNKFGQYQVLCQLARRLACPLISLEHTLPVPNWTPDQRAALSYMRGDVNVFITEHSVDQWQFTTYDPMVVVIEHGIDTDFFQGWCGGDGKVLTVVNDYINRAWCTGFDIWKEVIKGLPVNPWGATTGLSKRTQNEEHLLKIYQNASVFLNTSTISPIPTALLEAMSCGIPVVTTATCAIPSIVEDGVNGFLSNDPKVLRQRIIELLSNPNKAQRMGQAARKTIVTRFNQNRFVQEWNSLFRKIANGPALTWLQPM